jgi:hypothetical protein
MRTLIRTFVALGLVAALSAPALAQQGRGRGMGFGGGGLGMLLTNASVQQELKLDAAQIDKAKAVADKVREKIQSATSGLEGQALFAKMREISKEINEDVHKSVSEFMSKDQTKRLHQIHHQVQREQAFTDEHVQNKLKLTDAQKSEIDGIISESRGKMQSIREESQGNFEVMRTKMTELRKETVSKIEAKLTDEQKATYKEMLGAPFVIKFEGRPGGGR